MRKLINRAFAIIVTLLLLFLVGTASAETEIRPTVVVDYSMEPAVLMPGDIGTITMSIDNMATGTVYVKEDDETFDMNAYIASITLGGDSNIEVISKGYTDIGLLGPQDTIKLTFNVRAKNNATNGIHFLNMEVIGGSDMYDLNYNIPVKIDNRDLKLILATVPSTVMNEISTIEIDIINTRSNDISNVIMKPEGDGVKFNPSEVFVGAIPSGNKSTVTVTLNTMESTNGLKDVSFTASFFNGDNHHISEKEEATISVVEQTSLIFTSIEATSIGNQYTFTGDINNFGTTDAKNVLVSITGSDDIKPMQPYANYFVGTLEADDFSSFELSARILSSNVTKVPVLIEFRDTDNVYSSVTGYIDLENTATSGKNEEKSTMWMWAIAAVLLIAVAGAIAYSWKKREQAPEDDE